MSDWVQNIWRSFPGKSVPKISLKLAGDEQAAIPYETHTKKPP